MTVFLLGPTGVGKSGVGMALAEADHGAILSMDSMQVYRSLDIGTGKPTPAERARVDHGGLDLAPWWEPINTARYLQAAREFLAAHDPARPLYVVGGTGLYFRALTQGLCEAPAAPPERRELLQNLSRAELQLRLRRLDPGQEKEAGFDWSNPRRLQRALEVIEETGVPLREWQRKAATRPLVGPGFRAFLLLRDRDDLRARIEARVGKMLAAGWFDEARAMIARRSLSEAEACAAIGYGLLAKAFRDGGDPEAARQAIVDQTRQYAKRQLTWFTNEPNVQLLMIPPGELPAATALRVRAALASAPGPFPAHE